MYRVCGDTDGKYIEVQGQKVFLLKKLRVEGPRTQLHSCLALQPRQGGVSHSCRPSLMCGGGRLLAC